MEVQENLKYSVDHDWVKVEANKVTIGITDYAQDSLGTIVFVQLPELGSEIKTGEVLSVVESVKAASDVLSPVSGTIVDINQALEENPESLNNEPYESWIAVVELSDNSDLDILLDAEAYAKHCEG